MSKTIKKIKTLKSGGISNAKKASKALWLSNRYAKTADLAYYKAESGDFLPDQELNGNWKAGRELSF